MEEVINPEQRKEMRDLEKTYLKEISSLTRFAKLVINACINLTFSILQPLGFS